MNYKKFLLIFYLSFLFYPKFSLYFFEINYFCIVVFTILLIAKIKSYSNNELFKIFLIFFILKVLFVLKNPILSDDIYRYLWEGKVFLNGFNPYIYAPNSMNLYNLRDNIFVHINHKNLPAIYPPFMLFFNSIIVKICYSVKFYKFVLFLFDFSTFLLILMISNEAKINLRYSMLYFVHPLTVIEIEWNGHNDIVMIFLFMLGFYFLIKNRFIKSSFFYTLSVVSKFVYLIFAKDFLKNLKSIIVFFIVVIFMYSIFIFSDKNIFYSLNIYLKNWEFNGSIYKILKYFVKNHEIVRIILLCILCISWVIINFKVKNIFKRMLFLIMSFILYSPTVHPWYGLWILPFLCFEFYMEIYLFLLFLPFSYYVLEKYFSMGVWQENNFITLIIYLPLIFLLYKKHLLPIQSLFSKD